MTASIVCSECGDLKPIENKDTGLCASCNRKKRIADDRDLWPKARIMFLEHAVKNGFTCPITGREITIHDDVHHKMGRIGYADEWAREKDISLLLDVRFFLAVTRQGHEWIELHPEAAKAKGYSLSRLAKNG